MNESLTGELPGFDDPLGLLRACHERMLKHCDILEKLPHHITENGVDDKARDAIKNVLSYFSTSAVQHHEDEEQDLFPVLNRQSLKLADTVYKLKQEHEEMNRLWQPLAETLRKPDLLSDNTEFEAWTKSYSELCRRHITLENKELLTMAQHILSSEQLETLGRAMAKRRGQRY